MTSRPRFLNWLFAPEQYGDAEIMASAEPSAKNAGASIPLGRLRRRFASDFWALLDQCAVSGFNLLTTVILARMLGLHNFGVFTLAWLAVLFVNSLQVPLVISPMLAIGPQQSGRELQKYYGAVFVQECAFVAISALLMFAAMRFSNLLVPKWDLRTLALATVMASLPYQLQDFLRRYFFARGRQVAAFINDLISYGSQVVVLAILFALGALTVDTALYVMGATSLLAVLVGLPWIERMSWPSRGYLRAAVFRHWNSAKWLTSSALLQWTSANLFAIVAAAFLGPSAAGVLRALRNVLGVTHIWSLGLANVVPVRAAKHLRVGGVRPMVNYLRETAWIWSAVTLAFAIVVSIAPDFWLTILYGRGYETYENLLRLYAFGYLWVTLALPLNAAATALEYTMPIFWGYAASTVFSVLSSAPLTHYFGLKGAVCGIIVTQIILQTVSFLTLRRRVQLLNSQEVSVAA
jgi:O-antigen/teichoic acid export membrane protein